MSLADSANPANLAKRAISQIQLCIRQGLTSKALQLMKRYRRTLHARSYDQITDTVVSCMRHSILSYDSNDPHNLISYIFYESPYKNKMNPNKLYAGYMYLFEEACSRGSVDTVIMLLADDRITETRGATNGACLTAALISGRADVFRLLLQSPKIIDIPSTYHTSMLLERACTDNKPEIVELILAEPRLDFSVRQNGDTCLHLVCRAGYTHIVKLLIDDDRIDPAYRQNTALHNAASYNNYDTVLLLLEHPAVDPYAMGYVFSLDPVVVIAACKYGWVDLLRHIVVDEKFLSINMNPTPICRAAKHGQVEVVKLFLSVRHTSKLFDPTYGSFLPLLKASERGKLDVLKILLDAIILDLPNDVQAVRSIFSLFLDAACRSGSSDTVRYLLEDSRVDPAMLNSSCMLNAAYTGHTHILKLLLEDGRSNIFADYQIIMQCIDSNLREIIDMVFEQKIDAVRPGLTKLSLEDYNRYISMAKKLDSIPIARVIEKCRNEMRYGLPHTAREYYQMASKRDASQL